MSQRDLVGLIALDLACLFAAAVMLRAWSRRRTRPPIVAAILVVVLAIVASMLVVAGVTYTFVVGPTFIVALLAIMYAARYERGISRR
jgi:peptidoglycan/LPS O-acetylase OafA/YrhL